MKLNYKLISIVLVIQLVTVLVVFAFTRAYYIKPVFEAPSAGGDPTTEELINSLKQYGEQGTTGDDPEAINQQAHLAFQGGDYPRAAALYQRVMELSPNDARVHNNLGLTLHYLGRSQEAVKILQEGARLDPEFQRVWLTLGFVQSSLGNTDEARQALQQAVDLGADTPPGQTAKQMLDKLP